MLQQLKTQTQAYWQEEFAITERDLEFVYSLLIEIGHPLSTTEITRSLIEQRLDEELNQVRSNLKRGRPYQPQGSYQVGEGLVFPALDSAYGEVVGQRAGHNPEYGEFTVIEVKLEGEQKTREFASELQAPHRLNFGDSVESILSSLSTASADEIFALYGPLIENKIESSLSKADSMDFIRFGQMWYLKGLLADVHVGHRNVVEAVLDVSGTALSPPELLEQVDLPPEISPEAQLFSLNYALAHDERFDDVGTDDQVLWFLKRLEPPEALFPPRRLQATLPPYDRSVLTEELLRLERELDDELTSAHLGPATMSDVTSATVVLTYPHRRVGTVPLTSHVSQIMPRGSTQHTRITLIDGQTGSAMPGWLVHQHRYIYGLDAWFNKNNILVGAYITLEKTDDPFKIIINYRPRRERREWIRVMRPEDGRIRFEMQKFPCKCEYDELMITVTDDTEEIDALWIQIEEDGTPLVDILHHVFPELAKLNPQGTVHAKTVYSVVNILKRCPPGPIFAAMIENPSFVPVGGNYWLYEPPGK